tara:strand:+ start:15690 stop:16208 length:519 start_codon:yes stop_codon:yes gene_type:complete
MCDADYDDFHIREIQTDTNACVEIMGSFTDDTEFHTNMHLKDVNDRKNNLDTAKVDLYDTLHYKTESEIQAYVEHIKQREYEYNMTVHSIQQLNEVLHTFFSIMTKYTNVHYTIVDPLENEGYFLMNHKVERIHVIHAMEEYISLLRELLQSSIDRVKKKKIQFIDNFIGSS